MCVCDSEFEMLMYVEGCVSEEMDWAIGYYFMQLSENTPVSRRFGEECLPIG
jgi:hypothetical protein